MTTDNEPRWRALAEAAFEGVALLDEGVIVECNDALLGMLGGTRDEIIGRPATQFVAPEHLGRVRDAIESGRSDPYEVVGIRADGSRAPVEIRGRSVIVDGRPMRVTVLRDLSELRRSESRYQRLFEAAGDGIIIMDEDARPLEVNERICEMIGHSRDELLRMSPEQGIADLGDNPMQLARLRDEDRYVIERELRHAAGHNVDVEVSVTRLGPGEILAVIRDVSDRRRAVTEEAELRKRLAHAQKMESLGRLAGGIAHDFNNLLTVILANADLISREASSANLEEIIVASQRAGDLTRQLLAFSRKQVLHVTAIDPNESVREAAALLHRVLGEDVALEVELEPDVAHVEADPGQLVQVVMNLAVNARDAMPEGGSICLRTSTGELEGRAHVVLSVTDSGPGIDPGIRDQIFEPFFTTKEPGEGTGLGLATVFGIVTQSGGIVRVDDAPQSGTTFEVWWPSLEHVAAAPAEDTPIPTERRRLKILLVEDENAVRAVVERALSRNGHEVTAMALPSEVLARSEGFIDEFDLLLTDVIMPGMDGPTLARTLGAKCVVYMSGYAGDALTQRGVPLDPERFVEKPFTAATLLSVIERVTDEA